MEGSAGLSSAGYPPCASRRTGPADPRPCCERRRESPAAWPPARATARPPVLRPALPFGGGAARIANQP
eukprot:2136258-Alexandrium_andersonii.AAC.1